MKGINRELLKFGTGAEAAVKIAVLVVGVSVALAVLIAAGLGVAWWAGAFTEPIEPGRTEVAAVSPGPGRQYTVDEVHAVDKDYVAEAVGTLKAASRTEISSRIMAVIDRVAVRAGDVVQEGDVLVELDRHQLDTQFSQAESAVEAAETAVAQANDRYERAQRLRQESPGVMPDQDFNQIAYARDTALANQRRARQAAAEVEVLLSYTRIKAPKPGTVVDRLAEEGDTAQPGVPLLVLYDRTALRLEVPVMENLAVKLRVGDALNVKIDALGKTIQSTIDEIVPQAEAASRSFLVKVKLPPAPDLFEGMYGRLEIPAGRRRHLCLASAAIETVGQLQFVFVVDEDGAKSERRFIKTGRFGMPGRVEVLSGLEAGERVLVKRPANK